MMLAAAVLAAFAGWQILSARHHLLRGAQELRAARAGLTLNTWNRPAARDGMRTRLVEAEGEFASAQGNLGPWAPLTDHLGWVPIVGGQLAAASPVTDAALGATRSAIDVLDGLGPVASILAVPSKDRLPHLAAALGRSQSRFLIARREADGAWAALGAVPTGTGNRSLDRAITELRTRLPELRGAALWLGTAPQLLGARTPTHYLIVMQDPADIQATGGFAGAADFVTVKRGVLHATFTSGHPRHEVTSIPPPLPDALYAPEDHWEFISSNFSPDFPLAARSERWIFGQDTGEWADGVVDMQDTLIPSILDAVGPVYLPSFGVTADAANVTSLAQQYVNGTYHGPARQGASDTVRKQFMGQVVQAILQRLPTLRSAQLAQLAPVVEAAAHHRDIMFYSRTPSAESAADVSGMDGTLGPTVGDVLDVVDHSFSDSKLSPYMHESGSYQLSLGPHLLLHATLTLRYHLDQPPATIEGNGPWGMSKFTYQDFLRVYVPSGARLQSMRGVDVWAPAPAYGLTQFAGRFLLAANRTRIVRIRYTIPANSFAVLGFRSYTLTVRRQPGATLSSVRVALRASGGLHFATNGGQIGELARTVSLTSGDGHLTVPLEGVSNPAEQRFPSRTYPPDPYIMFGYLNDKKHQF